MVVNNLNVRRSWCSVRPLKTDPPLIIDSNAELPLTIAGQRFKVIAGQDDKVPQGCRSLQTVQLQACRSFDSGQRFHPFPSGEISGALVPITGDHTQQYRPLCITSSVTNSELTRIRDWAETLQRRRSRAWSAVNSGALPPRSGRKIGPGERKEIGCEFRNIKFGISLSNCLDASPARPK